MLATYNHPGASTFRAVYFPPTKEGKQKAREWWTKVHESNGPCAPGGGVHVTDKEALTWKWMDGSHIFHHVESVDGNTVSLRNPDQF